MKEKIAIPKKGRVFEAVFEILADAGFKIRKSERLDFCVCDAIGMEVYFLPAKDIPYAVASGAIQYGITGIDLIEDADVLVDTHLRLGIGKAKMVLATPEDSQYLSPDSLHGKRIGTSFVNLAQKFIEKHRVQNTSVVYFSGSVEVQVSLGVVDAIIDITETGTSLKANRLEVRETLLESEMVFISSKDHRGPALDLIQKRLSRVLRGRSHVLLKFNLPSQLLDKACSLSNGLSSPTVNHLADPEWLALEVVVPRKELHPLMDQLSLLGARGILSQELGLCVPDC